MKNAPIVLSSLALLGVIVLFVLHFNGDNSGKGKSTTSRKDSSSINAVKEGSKIVYVDIDTFNEKFNYLREKREAFLKRSDAMQSELQQSGQQMGREYEALKKKADAGTLTEAEGKAGEARIMQMEQSLKTRENTMSKQLAKEQEDFNTDLHNRIEVFLEKYNETKYYDYIFYYTAGSGAMLYANKQLDVTNEILEAVNKEFGDGKTNKEAEKK